MNRALATSLVIAVVSGCASSKPTTSPATSSSVASSVAPSVVATEPPISSATPRPTPFPTVVFAGLDNDVVPQALAAKLQDALAAMVPPGDGGIAATVMTVDGTWSGAAGKADRVHDMQPDSQFGIGSGTKPIVAAQVMMMVEAGEISLDRPATDYLPADFDFDTNGATIRQLLSHRSGIPDWYPAMKDQFAADRLRVWTLEEILALVPPGRRPAGDAIDYTDTNFNLLGLVIEHVRQRPIVDVLREGSLAVDGTDRLIWQPDEAPTDPMAMPRGESRDALELGGGFLPSRSDTIDGAAGGMASDSISLARWWRAFCGGEIVSQAALTEMSTFYSDGDDVYGLGLFNPAVGFAQGIGHLGGNFGYSSWSACLPEDQLIVVVLRSFEDDFIFEMGRPLVLAARSN